MAAGDDRSSRRVRRGNSGQRFVSNSAIIRQQVDSRRCLAFHAQVLERSKKITTAPYAGFIQPRLVPVVDANGAISDIKVEYPNDFIEQMLEYGAKHSFLPDYN